MKPTLKILKKNIFTILVIIVFIICMFGLSYFKKIYWDNNDKAAYGERSKDIDEHLISKEEVNKIKEDIVKIKNIESVTYDLKGRVINLIITVADDLSVKDAKALSGDIFKAFTDDELEYYAIQIYCEKKDSSKTDFPIIGYKHYSSTDISWTKDREVASDENK